MLGWRRGKVTDHRTRIDFAQVMRELVDVYFPDAERFALRLDNLNTHNPASLYQTYAPAEAKRNRDKVDIHPTAKHGSWLNSRDRVQCMTESVKPKRRRRGRGEHSIYQRKSDGRWIVEIRDGLKPSGKPRIKYLTAKTKTQANARLKTELARIAQGKPDAGTSPTVATYLAGWLTNTVKPHKRTKTFDSYEGMCRIHIIPRIG